MYTAQGRAPPRKRERGACEDCKQLKVYCEYACFVRNENKKDAIRVLRKP